MKRIEKSAPNSLSPPITQWEIYGRFAGESPAHFHFALDFAMFSRANRLRNRGEKSLKYWAKNGWANHRRNKSESPTIRRRTAGD